MKTRHLLLISILAGVANTPAVFAQAAPAVPLTDPSLNARVEATTTETPKRARAVSNDISASISATMPKYNPPPQTEPKPESELPDRRDTDKPRNTIIRLPEHIVREKAPPVFRDRDIHTKAGLGALAVRRYITDADRALNRYTIPLFAPISTGGAGATTDRALAMYAEDERLQNIADLNEAAGLASATDKAAGVYIKRETQKAYLRRDDMGPSERNTGAAK